MPGKHAILSVSKMQNTLMSFGIGLQWRNAFIPHLCLSWCGTSSERCLLFVTSFSQWDSDNTNIFLASDISCAVHRRQAAMLLLAIPFPTTSIRQFPFLFSAQTISSFISGSRSRSLHAVARQPVRLSTDSCL